MSAIEIQLQEVKQLLHTVLQHQQQNAIFSKPILNTDEAAAFLGIKKKLLYEYTSKGILPYSKPNGKELYFTRQDLIDWATQNRIPGRNERKIAAATYTTTKN